MLNPRTIPSAIILSLCIETRKVAATVGLAGFPHSETFKMEFAYAAGMGYFL
jgi:hypothetical protein